MKCPKDGAELTKIHVVTIDLDKCHHCDGIWFDAGELDRIRKLDRSDVEEQIEQKYGSPQVATGDLKGYMRCPRCADGRLQQYTYTYGNRVRIDRCHECLGVWVDNNELSAIIGEQQQLDKIANSGAIKMFMRAMANLVKSTD